jgi:vacuolar iron transporter family protein
MPWHFYALTLSTGVSATGRQPVDTCCARHREIEQLPGVSARNKDSAMPQTPHVEKHFTASETVRDIVIGMSDGLTVPFALAAGLSGAVEATAVIVTAGLAEVAAGSIAMGLGGYLAAKTDAEHFASELAREERETEEMPEEEAAEVAAILRSYGLEEKQVDVVVGSIRADKKRWLDFMMRFELGLEEPDPKRARNSALTIALSYVAGGLVPLAPYFFLRSVHTALITSVILTLLALSLFGYIKGRFTTARPFRSAWQTVIVGALAATAAFIIAKAIG